MLTFTQMSALIKAIQAAFEFEIGTKLEGASQGLGLEFVRQIVSQPEPPKHLFAACRDPWKVQELRCLAEHHPCLKVVTLDVSRDEDIVAAFQQTACCVGDEGLNLLINNADLFEQPGDSLLELTREKLQTHFDVNATVPVLMTQKFLPLLKKAAENKKTDPIGYTRAAIINLSTIMGSIESTLSTAGSCDSYHYRASKAALNMLTALMSVELKGHGILVAAIHPGWAKSDKITSVQNLMSTIAQMTEKSSGLLHNYDGKLLPW